MIVCICHNVNSAAIDAAMEGGATTLDAVRKQTAAASGCGKCQFKINRMLHEHAQRQRSCKPVTLVGQACS